MVYICTNCGEERCMYCGHNWERWWTPGGKRYSGYATALPGLFATWVTDDMLALSRPSSRIIKQFGLLKEFQKAGVHHLFNLTEYGEHPHCGDKLAPGSGFSYTEQEVIAEGIGYSNPSWEDLGVPSFEVMESIVEQARGILAKGGKIAVHCHAGMGRTGLVIACVMISKGMEPEDALLAVRAKRPGSVQSASQEEFLVRFADYLAAKGKGRAAKL